MWSRPDLDGPGFDYWPGSFIVLLMFVCFLPKFKDRHVRLIAGSKLYLGVNECCASVGDSDGRLDQ